ncbi:hypothetical protein [Caudoviricetes sp.]|nr:hypothetical protein [Caudoviricetes sp.]
MTHNKPDGGDDGATVTAVWCRGGNYDVAHIGKEIVQVYRHNTDLEVDGWQVYCEDFRAALAKHFSEQAIANLRAGRNF